MEKLKLSFLQKSDIAEAARVLGKAMLTAPLHVAVFQGQGENELKKIEDMFGRLLRDLPGITFLACMESDIVGVMRMKTCDGRKVSEEGAENHDPSSPDGRVSFWHREWARHDPVNQHWHLGPVGVLPAYQGKGIGTKLMERFCMEVDACSAVAYLETDTSRNVRFYRRFGFEVVAESDIFGITNCYMSRPPAGA